MMDTEKLEIRRPNFSNNFLIVRLSLSAESISHSTVFFSHNKPVLSAKRISTERTGVICYILHMYAYCDFAYKTCLSGILIYNF